MCLSPAVNYIQGHKFRFLKMFIPSVYLDDRYMYLLLKEIIFKNQHVSQNLADFYENYKPFIEKYSALN